MFAEISCRTIVTKLRTSTDCREVLLNAHNDPWIFPVALRRQWVRELFVVFGINQVAIEIYTDMSSISAS